MAKINLFYERFNEYGPIANGIPPHLFDETDWRKFYDSGYIIRIKDNPDSLYKNLSLISNDVAIKSINDEINSEEENWLVIDVAHKIQGALEHYPFWKNLSEKSISRIKAGLLKLIIWNAQEHSHHKHAEDISDYLWYVNPLTKGLEELNTPLSSVTIITGDLNIKANFKKLYPNSDLNIFGYNYFEYNYFSYANQHYIDNTDEDGIYPEKGEIDRGRLKHFLCLNGAPNDHRLFIVSELYRKGLNEKGYISLLQRNIDGYPIKLDYYLEKYEENEQEEIQQHFETFIKQLPIKLDVDTSTLAKNDRALPKQFILDSYFSIINESFISVEKTDYLFITEKCFKPFYYMQPFVVLGCKGTLKQLKEIGYKTFDAWFDESYDEIDDKRERLKLIVQETERICKLPLSDLKKMYLNLLPVLEYNRAHFLNKSRIELNVKQLANNIAGKNIYT